MALSFVEWPLVVAALQQFAGVNVDGLLKPALRKRPLGSSTCNQSGVLVRHCSVRGPISMM